MWIFPCWQREVLGLLKKQQKQIDEQQKQIEEMSKKIEFIAIRVAWGSNAWEFGCLDKDRVQQKIGVFCFDSWLLVEEVQIKDYQSLPPKT